MALVKLDGQEFEIDNSIAADDNLIRQSLTPFYPAVANATINRETKDDQEIITIVKRAGTKGMSTPLEQLLNSPEEINPALRMAWRLRSLEGAEEVDPMQLIALQEQIDIAIEAGDAEAQKVEQSLRFLHGVVSQEPPLIPIGF